MGLRPSEICYREANDTFSFVNLTSVRQFRIPKGISPRLNKKSKTFNWAGGVNLRSASLKDKGKGKGKDKDKERCGMCGLRIWELAQRGKEILS